MSGHRIRVTTLVTELCTVERREPVMTTTLSRANQDDPDADIPGSEPRRVGQARSKRLLVTLLGDFWEHGREPFPSARLVRILEEFQITAANARAALSRLTQQGLLART